MIGTNKVALCRGASTERIYSLLFDIKLLSYFIYYFYNNTL